MTDVRIAPFARWTAVILAGAALAALALPASAADVKLPRLANGHPDFTGIWQSTSSADYDLEPHAARKDAPPGQGIVEGNVIP